MAVDVSACTAVVLGRCKDIGGGRPLAYPAQEGGEGDLTRFAAVDGIVGLAQSQLWRSFAARSADEEVTETRTTHVGATAGSIARRSGGVAKRPAPRVLGPNTICNCPKRDVRLGLSAPLNSVLCIGRGARHGRGPGRQGEAVRHALPPATR